MSSAVGLAIIALIGMWMAGGVVMRLGGVLVAMAGVIGLAIGAGASGALVASFGTLIWLVGQGHYAMRHGPPKSRLFQRLIGK